ncbi:uncharacterized protein [Gossypium hirsutum]|uniref:Retrotransposon gag domain-containing protein n=1 Tax=Gossypium hirsutum TaxID=3635 RepID=A0A1U8IN05_GOSHI|nr:uncharacterized protein LOC107896714 [Gossypium hirsutum]
MDTDFELKSGLIQLLPTFRGLQNENPHKHLKEFHMVCHRMKPQGLTEDQIKLCAFPFSLADSAKEWFFPASQAAELRREIIRIRQKEAESLYDYWERFKKLCASCPQHGITEKSLLQYFYEGLKPMEMNMQTLNFQKETKNFQKKTEVSIRELTTSIEKLTSQGKLPSQTEPNPRKNANAIMLRRGKVLESIPDRNLAQEITQEKPKKNEQVRPKPPLPKIQPPFPERFNRCRRGKEDKEIVKKFRNVEINIPLLDTIKQIPRSVVHLEGVLEDVLVKVNDLIFPVDFYVIKMEEDSTPGSSDLLLGRPFLSTTSTKIDVQSGTLTMEFDGEIVKFNVYDAISHPSEILSVNRIDIIDSLVEENFESIYGDNSELNEFEFVNELLSSNTKLLPSVIQAPELELEPPGKARKLDNQELEEIHNDAYENAHIYKDKTELFHAKRIAQKRFSVGQKVLLHNSVLKLFPGKLRSRWQEPFIVTKVFTHGAVEIESEESGKQFVVNGQRLKPFYENF